MRYFVLSDIHGSAYYANLAIEAYRKSGCERILLLGDVLYHGPRNPLPKDYAPKEVIALLNPLKEEILAVRGNPCSGGNEEDQRREVLLSPEPRLHQLSKRRQPP